MSVPGASLQQRAMRLCAGTVGWNVLVGGSAVATALATGSLALIGFGVNAIVDSSVSALLVWRFWAEWAGHVARAIRIERIALRVAAAAFSVIAVYVLVRACVALVSGHRTASSVFGVVEASASLIVLPYLAISKYRLSERLGSPALRADSLLTVSGVALAAIALGGLLAQRELGWWWADPVAGLMIASFLGWQGVRALRDARQPDAREAIGLVL
jgi:divalent metal cation (Fe/Co/Zn/Cd) transporter